MEIEEFIRTNTCSVLYHMCEKGSWEGIQKRGLLSTTALLDLYKVRGERRFQLESQLRRKSETISNAEMPELGQAVLRDQDPMIDRPESGIYLSRLLKDTSEQQWFELLNRKTFFWVNQERLLVMLCARNYRYHPHWVIRVDSEALLRRHKDRVSLAWQNTGSLYSGKLRGQDTFVPFEECPVRGGVVELAVEYSIPDIADLAIDVTEYTGMYKEGERVRQKGPVIWSRGKTEKR